MPDGEATFLVNPHSDPVLVKIQGRASFLNATPVSDFFRHMMDQGKRRFIVVFEDCTGMDSTFMGILAGAGINLMKSEPRGSMVLARLGPRNLELVRNLGLDRLMTIDEGSAMESVPKESTDTLTHTSRKPSSAERAQLVLEAHENLVKADPSNEAKFQDVISFLRNQTEG